MKSKGKPMMEKKMPGMPMMPGKVKMPMTKKAKAKKK